MPHFLKIALITAGAFLLVFFGLIVAFGGGRSLSLNEKIVNSASLIPQTIQTPNLTETLSARMATEINQKNPEGPATSSDATITFPSPKELIEKTLSDSLKDFDANSLRPFIQEEDIIVEKFPPADADEVYLKKFLSILGEHLTTDRVDMAHPEQADFLKMSKNYKAAMAALAAIPAPPPLVEIHIQGLELLGAQANCFELLSNYDADPLKALLAAQFQESLAQEVSEFQQKVISYMQEHHINL